MSALPTSRILLLALVAAGLAVAPPLREAQADPPAPADTSAAAASPVSATGLLPIFGVGVDFDALPGKTSAGKPEEAVAAVQKLWKDYLKGAGFNVIQFSVDVSDLGDKGAGRLAALCRWAATNNVRLAPTLIGAKAGEALPADFPDKAGAFAARTIELVSQNGNPGAYSQIMFYQLERPLNHPGNHGAMEPSAAAEIITHTIEKLRASEQAALAGSQLQA
ncbi:MAG TPA: hypothetical protein VF363_05850, partial [Candidatus Eisenbacteria bacterium]